jgi:hypothetical protein
VLGHKAEDERGLIIYCLTNIWPLNDCHGSSRLKPNRSRVNIVVDVDRLYSWSVYSGGSDAAKFRWNPPSAVIMPEAVAGAYSCRNA